MRKFTEPEIKVAGLTPREESMAVFLATSTGNNRGTRILLPASEKDTEIQIEKDYWAGK